MNLRRLLSLLLILCLTASQFAFASQAQAPVASTEYDLTTVEGLEAYQASNSKYQGYEVYVVTDGATEDDFVVTIFGTAVTLKEIATGIYFAANVLMTVEYFVPEIKVWREEQWNLLWQGRCYDDITQRPVVDVYNGVTSWH